MRIAIALLILFASMQLAAAQIIESNQELGDLQLHDQADRRKGADALDGSVVRRNDHIRRQRVLTLLREGRVRSSNDFYSAAMVFQHGESPDDAKLAHSLAVVSATMNPDNTSARWLAAAAWDRYMLRLKRPQWYGTQYSTDEATGLVTLYTVDETAVTDEQRLQEGVPTLAHARARAKP
jgi:hypothetical protein